MIRTLVHDAVGEGALDSQEAQYIEKIFDFGNKSLSDIMRPRSDIQFLSADLPVAESAGPDQGHSPVALPGVQGAP
jgi:putative hemolysin